MDNVLELAARATSYLILLQDALALVPDGPHVPLWQLRTAEVPALRTAIWAEPMLKKKALALIGSATGLPVTRPDGQLDVAKPSPFQMHIEELLAFVQQRPQLFQPKQPPAAPPPRPQPQPFRASRQPLAKRATTPPPPTDTAENIAPAAEDGTATPPPPDPAAMLGHVPHYLAPEAWRQALQQVLYQDPASREALARALDYIPTLVYELIGAPGREVYLSRLDRLKRWVKTRWRALRPTAHLPSAALPWTHYLQLSNEHLAADLKASELAVPFEVMFSQELGEVTARRAATHQAALVTASAGPLCQADALGLCALALSGGGIRSATFNLGLLQGLASAGWLPRFDYLSTVSGGGYLGSWLAAWIQREGSLGKVTARLCPGASPRPQADEVRAIRWLRMYSNYLAPKPGSLTADAWTIGTTWLRNTLLTQFIIVLALGTALALGSAVLYGWFQFSWQHIEPNLLGSQWQVLVASFGLLAPITLLAGSGMRPFRDDLPLGQPTRSPGVFKWLLPGLAVLGAYAASGYLYHSPYPGFGAGCTRLWPAAAVATVALVGVAWWGGYDKCFYHNDRGRTDDKWWARWALFIILFTSILASMIGVAGVVGVWKVLDSLAVAADAIPGPVPTAGMAAFRLQLPLYLAFIVGVPLVLEALILAVVARMAMLGRNFPDERREWWGRMGAVLHRAMAGWVLLAGTSLLLRVLARVAADPEALGLDPNNKGLEGLLAAVFAGSWLTLVGKAVQLAFSARTRATKPDAPGTSSRLDQVLSVAPYAFGLGLLVLTQGAVYWLLHYWLPEYVFGPLHSPAMPTANLLMWRSLALFIALGILAALLGWRVGVNEFSLHHFYRNRLVRAYLGASRFRFDREHTANAFTGFDSQDDVKLCTLRRTPVAPSLAAASQQKAAPTSRPPYDGPFLLLNATLNVTKVKDLAQQDRQAESFVFTPLYCGFDFARIRALNPARQHNGYNSFGYRPTEQYAYPHDNGPGLGTAMAISGAAASPNEGYHSSPATAFLLTLFNLRLGWWMGNPSRGNTWQKADPRIGFFYLFKDLFGRSASNDAFVNLSDGGHFDNMGLYELVRRRCRYIVLGDGEEDHLFTCDGLANAIRRCRVDFGVEINLDVSRITTRTADYSAAHYAVGTIHYPDDEPGQPTGRILYVKSSLTNDEPTDVREYAQYNKAFPHQSTGDQFFSEAQFESYRRLGLHIFETLAHDNPLLADPTANFDSIFKGFK